MRVVGADLLVKPNKRKCNYHNAATEPCHFYGGIFIKNNCAFNSLFEVIWFKYENLKGKGIKNIQFTAISKCSRITTTLGTLNAKVVNTDANEARVTEINEIKMDENIICYIILLDVMRYIIQIY